MTRTRIDPIEGMVIDGFRLGPLLHAGGMARIHAVTYADGSNGPGFALVMKIPRMDLGDGAENILSFEVEAQLLQVLSGPQVPRLVACGDLDRLPYLVLERIEGDTLETRLANAPLPESELQTLGLALCQAVHQLHQQDACHLDLKPANVMLRPDGTAVLLDFGLSCHAAHPDLLAEVTRKAVGSAAWIAPEQLVGIRGDPRSDLYAIGVMLYQLATATLPFGNPASVAGQRQRLWRQPVPPRVLAPQLSAGMQELILQCLEPEADQRPQSAAHLAFQLRHPEQIRVGERGQRLHPAGFRAQFRRWWRALGRQWSPSPLPSQQIHSAPIVMVALPHADVRDDTLWSLRQAVSRSLGIRPGARLAVVSVLAPQASSLTDAERSETLVHRQHRARQSQWARGLDLAEHPVSFHVLEDSDVAGALLRYARLNAVDLIVLGAATHGLTLQRVLATVPMKVSMDAPCSVLLVKQTRPYHALTSAVSAT